MSSSRVLPRIRPEEILPLLPDVAADGLRDGDLIGSCLQALLVLGFDRARYYEIDEKEPHHGRICVLTRYVTATGPLPSRRGYTIPWRETALARLTDGCHVVRAQYDTFAAAVPWQRDLDLLDRESVDIPVISNGRVVGLFAADCEPGALDLSARGESVLLSLGVLAGSAATEEQLPLDLAPLNRRAENTSPEEYAVDAAKRLFEVIGGEVGALFGYDWRRNRLQKISEFSVQGDNELSEFPEQYVVGENLTGQAWLRESYRYIPDFELFRRDQPSLVSTTSLEHHEAILDHPIKSVLYGILGRSESRYLVRIFNRRHDPLLPFLGLERRFVAAAEVLAVGFDDLVAKRRLHFVTMTARSGITNITRPDLVISTGRDGLADEGIRDFVVLCQVAGSRRPALVHAEGSFGALELELLDIDVPDEVDLAALVEHSSQLRSVAAIRKRFPALGDVLEEGAGGSLEADVFCCFRSEAGQTSGLLLAEAGRGSRNHRHGRKSAPTAPSAAAVQTLLDLFVEAVESRSAHLTARGARHAMGYVGHELGTPLTMLGDAAVAAVNEALTAVAGLQEVDAARVAALRVRMRRLYTRVQDSRGATLSAFKLAPLVVQVGDGTLPMYFTSERLRGIIDDSVDQISTMTRNRQQRDSGSRVRDISRQFRIEVSDSDVMSGTVVCDRYLIRQVLVNLLDNAVKYSLPRWPSRETPMSISVSASTPIQGELSIQVQNWGIAVDRKNMSAIFEPFVRGEQEDRLKAIRGMGLGLYLARLIAEAHGGSLQLLASHSTKSGRQGMGRENEGFLTVFEVRLRQYADEGPHRFVWSDNRGRLIVGA